MFIQCNLSNAGDGYDFPALLFIDKDSVLIFDDKKRITFNVISLAKEHFSTGVDIIS